MLTDRQRLILSAIINDYIDSNEPVGSRSISKHEKIGLSAATIRNEMSDLEAMGFLEQPHTSAGRIPSQKGYRYFVDHLIERGRLSSHELNVLHSLFSQKIDETEKVMQQVAFMMSHLTNYTTIALGGEIKNTTIKHIQFVPIQDNKAVAIIVTNTGHVENKIVTIPPQLPIGELEKMVNVLNHKLKDTPLTQLKEKLMQEVRMEMAKHVARYEELFIVLQQLFTPDQDHKVYLSGTTNMLDQPEFTKDLTQVKKIMNIFEDNQAVTRLFSSVNHGIQVHIGEENKLTEINNCSLITATYAIDDETMGVIGILGPTRMNYGKVLNLLDYISNDFQKVIKGH
ncbi:heat-inducible transcriptional repressor HrcA [Longirhabdus pacifica]|uniref:heat-inducible transcriptional repressor HrcA n=1 Tax=Longirhabdus pacifica TaxID=2305227 RepID=UPI001008F2F5|nr:heat-inducible transcriptional repressor HrcA [Longirhabdus pacifica]